MRRDRTRFIPLAAVVAAAALAVTACGTSSAGVAGSATTTTRDPITVGISVPLTGMFAADGVATLRGYQLWASDVNRNGGLLGRPVKLVVRNDKSDPNRTAQDYRQLIGVDHVALTLAPFSTLLTEPAATVTERAGYALPAGSAVGELVYHLRDPYLFSVSVPAAQEMQPFATWAESLTGPDRPKTAAYPIVDDPFADPPVETTAAELQSHGIRTVFQNFAHPAGAGALGRIAQEVAAKAPDMVVLGSVDVPSVDTFVHAFEAAGYTPKIFIAASGPDQGQAFFNTVGRNGSEGVMVPNGWYSQEANALSHAMVQDYIEKYGGTGSDINADVAEAYSAAETLAAAVTGTHSTSNAAIKQFLHAHPVQTAEGTALFAADGENTQAVHNASVFQWQNGHFFQVLGPGATQKPVVRMHG